MKKYSNLADNSKLDKNDKYGKEKPLYDITNKSLQQFGYWYVNIIFISRQCETNLSDSIIKISSLPVLMVTLYILVSFVVGAKGIGGTPCKDFTLRVVTELVLKSCEELGNLRFDN